MDIDDAWRNWRSQKQAQPRRRRRMKSSLPVAKLDPAETRRWFIPRDEVLAR